MHLSGSSLEFMAEQWLKLRQVGSEKNWDDTFDDMISNKTYLISNDMT